MTEQAARLHLKISGETPRAVGISRGSALGASLGKAYEEYAGLFRALGVDEGAEREAADLTLETVSRWRPATLDELEGVAEGSGLELWQVAAVNARTEIIALSPSPSRECSTITSVIDGHRYSVQTWDWHIEFDEFWHTHEVEGAGMRFVGLTEHGILSKIGVNEQGLAVHFNILGHRDDRPGGVPMHLLSHAVMSECATVDEALDLIRSAPVTSSTALALLDPNRAVSAEVTPAGVFEIPEVNGSVQRTNHFQHAEPLRAQKTDLYEPDSSERLGLIRDRMSGGLPADVPALVRLLESGPGDPPLTCAPDMTLGFGEHWATLATVVSDPERREARILAGNPTEAESKPWRVLAA